MPVPRHVTRVLGELILFCTEVENPAQDGKYVGNASDIQGLPIPDRQRLIVEQNMLPMLVAMLVAPFKPWGGRYALSEIAEQQDRIKQIQQRRAMLVSHDRVSRREFVDTPPLPRTSAASMGSAEHKASSQQEGTGGSGVPQRPPRLSRGESGRRNAMASVWAVPEPDPQILAIYRVIRLVYKLLRHIFCDNRENELKVAVYVARLLGGVCVRVRACACVCVRACACVCVRCMAPCRSHCWVHVVLCCRAASRVLGPCQLHVRVCPPARLRAHGRGDIDAAAHEQPPAVGTPAGVPSERLPAVHPRPRQTPRVPGLPRGAVLLPRPRCPRQSRAHL